MNSSWRLTIVLFTLIFVSATKDVNGHEDSDDPLEDNELENPCQSDPCAKGCEITVQTRCPPDPAMINGILANVAEFPFMASLQRDGEHFCGGSLISDRHVITAAHCVDEETWFGKKQVGLGLYNVGKRNSKNLFSVKKITSHPNWDGRRLINDIAIVELSRPIPKRSKLVKPVNLGQNPRPGTRLLAAGWGVVNGHTQQPSKNLLKATLSVMSNNQCQRKFSGPVPFSQICTENVRSGTCQGDSGGPLVNKRNGEYYLVGLTSYSLKHCPLNTADVFTRVSHYTGWIRRQITSQSRQLGNNAFRKADTPDFPTSGLTENTNAPEYESDDNI